MQDDANVPDRVDEAGESTVEIVSIPDEFGTILLGSDRDMEEFAQAWDRAGGEHVVDLSVGDVAPVLRAVPQLGATTQAVRYLLGPKLWRQADSPKPGTVVTYNRITRSTSSGRILANKRVAAPAAAMPGVGEVVLAVAALEVALNQIAARIEARLDVIDDKVDELLRLASAQRLGDVYGHRRVLKRRLAEVNAGATLTDTDWSSIASVGTDLEVGVERLRQHALQMLSGFADGDAADKRARNLRDAVEKGRLCETLRLLLVAQQSLYMWQRLRLERVAATEPDHLAQTVDSARRTLREHLDADRDLASELRRTLEVYATIGITEVHHQLAARAMTKFRTPLAEMVDKFIDARALQVDQWLGTRHAGFRDVLNTATSTAAELTRSSRRTLARWIEPKEQMPDREEPPTDDTTDAKP